MYKFVDKTNKVISFKRIYLEKNTKEASETNDKDCNKSKPILEPNKLEHVQTLKSNVTYEQAINSFPFQEKKP